MALLYDPAPFMPVPPVAQVQNPLKPTQDAKTLAAMAEQRKAATKLQQALLRAQVLREQPLYAQGAGPLGITIGQGPGGWAQAIGSAVAGILAKKAHEKAGEETAGALGEVGPATQTLAENYIQGSPGGLYNTGYGPAAAQPPGPQLVQRPIYQGAPLSYMNPLGLGP